MEPLKTYTQYLDSQGSVSPECFYKCSLCGQEMTFLEIANHPCHAKVVRIPFETDEDFITTE